MRKPKIISDQDLIALRTELKRNIADFESGRALEVNTPGAWATLNLIHTALNKDKEFARAKVEEAMRWVWGNTLTSQEAQGWSEQDFKQHTKNTEDGIKTVLKHVGLSDE